MVPTALTTCGVRRGAFTLVVDDHSYNFVSFFLFVCLLVAALDSKINRSVGSQLKTALDRLQKEQVSRLSAALEVCGGSAAGGTGRQLMGASCDLAERRRLVRELEEAKRGGGGAASAAADDARRTAGVSERGLSDSRSVGRRLGEQSVAADSRYGARGAASLNNERGLARNPAAPAGFFDPAGLNRLRSARAAVQSGEFASLGLAGRATFALDAAQGVSQAVAAGMAAVDVGRGFGTMWRTGRFDGKNFGHAVGHTIDALTFGVGTTSAAIDAAKASANCVNSHGWVGCGRAAAHGVAQGVRGAARATSDCFGSRGGLGCVSHAAAATGRGLWGFARGLAHRAAQDTRAVAHGVQNSAHALARGSNWCMHNLGECRRRSSTELGRGFRNVGHALYTPVANGAR